jgi:hypothetical protein
LKSIAQRGLQVGSTPSLGRAFNMIQDAKLSPHALGRLGLRHIPAIPRCTRGRLLCRTTGTLWERWDDKVCRRRRWAHMAHRAQLNPVIHSLISYSYLIRFPESSFVSPVLRFRRSSLRRTSPLHLHTSVGKVRNTIPPLLLYVLMN